MFALAAAALGAAAGMITIAPAGCASDCGNDCPLTTATIRTTVNVDPGILDLAWVGPACPMYTATCRGDDQTTFCNRIDVTASAAGTCDVLIQLVGREPMAVHLAFGPPATKGCCQGFPVIGDYLFTIPLPTDDGGIYAGDGNTDAVSILKDGGSGFDAATDATDAGDAGADRATSFPFRC
jgi:hypothetical protein